VYAYHILLGGNIGDTALIFKKSLFYIGLLGCIEKKSSIHKTPPWGKSEQRYYLNQMILLKTKLGPFALLRRLKRIEKIFHRRGKGQMLPRKLDLDIISFGNHCIISHSLILPHPLMHIRAFVLTPMLEISPEFNHPLLDKKIQELLDDMKHMDTL
jgi:2-amino-4-hydroxy-6-hydroxymethyldihydropteridine diphosphokinase